MAGRAMPDGAMARRTPAHPAAAARAARRRLLGASAVALAGAAWPGLGTAADTAPPGDAAGSAPAPEASAAPPEVAAAWPGVRLQGQAPYRWFGLSIYHARLWVPQHWRAPAYAEQPFALELRYARAFRGEAIAERSITEMRRLGELDAAQVRAWTAAMREAFPDVAAGDRLTGLHRPARGAQFFHNARWTRSIDDPAFAAMFFGIWLAPQGPEPALRRALLGALG